MFSALSFTQVIDGSENARALGAAGMLVGLCLHVAAVRLLVVRGRRGRAPGAEPPDPPAPFRGRERHDRLPGPEPPEPPDARREEGDGTARR